MSIPTIVLNEEESNAHFSFLAAKEARFGASSAAQASHNDQNAVTTSPDPPLFHSTPPVNHASLDDEAYTRLRDKASSAYKAANWRSGYGPLCDAQELRHLTRSYRQATSTPVSSPTLTISTPTSYSAGSSPTLDLISPAERMMLKSFLTAVDPLLVELSEQLIEDARQEENMFVGNFEYLPILLLFSAVFLFGFSICGIIKAVRHWGLQLLAWLQPQPQGIAQPQNPASPEGTAQPQGTSSPQAMTQGQN